MSFQYNKTLSVNLSRAIQRIYFLLFNFLYLLPLHEFDDGHFGIVTLTSNGPQNTSISSLTVGVTVWCSFKKRVDKVLVIHPGHGLTACMQITSLSKLNHVVDVLSYCTCTNQGSLDASVPDNFSGKSAKQGLALISGLS